MSAPRRVLVWNNTTGFGGAERSLLEFLTAAVEQRPEIRFFATNPPGAELARRLEGLDLVRLEAPGLVFRRSRNPWSLLRFLTATLRANLLLRRLLVRHRIDLVHANNTSAALLGAVAARLAGVPLVWHVRDAVPLPWVGWFLERWAASIVTVSDAIRSQVVRRHPEKVTTVYNGVLLTSRLAAAGSGAARSPDDGLPGGTSPAGERRTEIPRSQIPRADVVMVAQFVPWKRHALMIDVIGEVRRRWPRVRLLLLGACHDAEAVRYLEGLEQRVRQAGLEDHISFGGYREDVYEVLRRARVLVHPAVGEPMGRVVVEALLLKTPVVAARSGGVPELLGHGAYGELVEPDDVAGFAEAICRVLGGEIPATRTDTGFRWAMETFDAGRQSRKILDLYAAAVNTAGGSRAD